MKPFLDPRCNVSQGLGSGVPLPGVQERGVAREEDVGEHTHGPHVCKLAGGSDINDI